MSGGRPALDLTLYLITDAVICGERGVAATAAAAARAGATCVQLRDPDASDLEFTATGRELVQALGDTGVPLIINDRVHLVDAIGANGAHVGQDDLDIAEARRLLGPDAWLGLSVQTEEQLAAAQARGVDVLDYLGVGPVWATATKPRTAPPGGPGRLERIAAVSPWPCVAIGGITADKVPLIRRTGVDGIAVVSAICGQPDIDAATRRIRDAWETA